MFSPLILVLTISLATQVVGKPTPLAECPPAQDIFPCHCTVDMDTTLHLDCSSISSETELSEIFSHEFPSNEFHSLNILNNHKITKLEEGTLGKLTFVEIRICQGALVDVKPKVFQSSISTLKKLDLCGNPLKFFPFDEIESFTVLEKLYLCRNDFNYFPRIASNTLRELDLAGTPVGNPPADIMKDLPASERVYLYSCNISEIQTDTFTGLKNLSYLSLADNRLTSLSPKSFELHGSNARIFFTFNDIVSVANDSMTGVSYFINISANKLVNLEEGVWRPILENGARLSIEDNPLSCECDVAWLVRDPEMENQIYGDSKCSDGTPLKQLDPMDFEMC